MDSIKHCVWEEDLNEENSQVTKKMWKEKEKRKRKREKKEEIQKHTTQIG